MNKELGKIQEIKFGIGGYQDAMIGLHISLGGTSWGVNDSRSTWDYETVKWTENCRWTEEDRDKHYVDIVRFISKLLKDAKVNSIDQLKGKPIEATFDGNILKEWRILTEVL